MRLRSENSSVFPSFGEKERNEKREREREREREEKGDRKSEREALLSTTRMKKQHF